MMKKSLLAVLFLAFASQAGAMVFYQDPDPDPVVEFKYISPTDGKEYHHKVRKSILTEVGLRPGQEATLDQIIQMYRIQDRKEAEAVKK